MVILDIDKRLSGCVATVGSFDGIHLGHKKIFKLVSSKAKELNLPDIIITFRQHPRFVVQPSYDMKLLTTIDEKISLMDGAGVSMVKFLEFNRQMAALTAEEFVQKYLVEQLNIKALVVGFNHRLGKGRGAGYGEFVEMGKKYGFSVHKVEPVLFGNEPISSSRIRTCMQECDIEQANKMLGYEYFFYGQVVQGKKLGKEIGFPTANLKVDKRKMLPCPGVYAVRVNTGERQYKGVLNYGRRPTIENDVMLVPEVHIIDFAGNLYNKTIKVSFVKYLRSEKDFGSISELKKSIAQDIERALEIL